MMLEVIESNMFSIQQKRQIADAVQKILQETGHPELPTGEISFHLHVNGAESWSWADIKNNGAVLNPELTPTPGMRRREGAIAMIKPINSRSGRCLPSHQPLRCLHYSSRGF
jgi:hypothetical protein